MSRKRQALAALAATLAACATPIDETTSVGTGPPTLSLSIERDAAPLTSGPAPEAPPPLSSDADALAIAERWFLVSHGFNALEAYEIQGLSPTVRFALARKWSKDRVKVLAYVTEPKELDEVAFLILREPGRPAEVFSYASPRQYRGGRTAIAPRTVFRVPRIGGGGLGTGNATSISSEVVSPILPDDFTFTRLPDAEVSGESCYVLEARPVRRSRALTHLMLSISKRTDVALRTVYYREEQELRTVTVAPEDVRQHESRWVPYRHRVVTADGTEAYLVLRNIVTDIPLADQLFTHHNLRVRRLPRF